MTRLSVKALTLTTLVFGISSQTAKADVDLTDGIRAFVCDGVALVFEETDAGQGAQVFRDRGIREFSPLGEFVKATSLAIWVSQKARRQAFLG